MDLQCYGTKKKSTLPPRIWRVLLLLLISYCYGASSQEAFAQTPGIIFKLASPTANPLDPNGDGFTSPTTAGFIGTDVGSGSEIPYKSFPQITVEPTSDLGPGPACKFTDIVDNGQETGVSMFVNASNDFLFRFRLGGSAPNAKGYSVLLDIDQRFGTSGPNADPNAVPGNPGFEIEIVLTTGGSTPGVNVYNTDGRSYAGGSVPQPVAVTSTPTSLGLTTNFQKSVAITTNCGDLDVFYDFYAPLSVIQSAATAAGLTFDLTTPFRAVGNTVIAAQQALQLHTISDLNGVNTSLFGNNIETAWTGLVNNFQPTTATTIKSGGSFPADRSLPPVIDSSIPTGSTTVSGTSLEPAGTIITVYRNGVVLGTTTVQAGGTWTFTLPAGQTFTSGSNITATAQATGELLSVLSNTVVVGGNPCTGLPSRNNVTLTCTSQKGIQGTVAGVPAGTIVRLYQVTTAGITSTASTLQATTDASGAFFAKCNTSLQNCNSGTNADACLTGSFVITTQEPGRCESGFASATFCSNNQVTATPVLTPTQTLRTSTTSVTGTVTTSGSPTTVFLLADGAVIGSVTLTATGTNIPFTISPVSLEAGNLITALAISSGSCASAQSSALSVAATAPFVNSPIYPTSTAISGTSIEAAGTLITVYRGGVAIGTTTVDANGNWSLATAGIALTSGDNITAAVTTLTGTAVSPISNTVVVRPQTTSVPTVTGPILEGQTTVTGTAPGIPNGGLINVYEDGFLIGTAVVSGGTWTLTVSSNPAAENFLYAGGVITAAAVAPGSYEGPRSTGVTVQCPALVTNNAVTATPTAICSGQSSTITVANSIPEYVYTLQNAATNATISTSRAGNGGTLAIPTGNLFSTVTIRVQALKVGATLCTANLSSTATVTVNPNPTLTNTVIAETPLCTGASANITVANSQTGFTYQLRNGTTSVSNAVAGNGGNVILTSNIAVAQNSTVTYNVLVYNTDLPTCSGQLTQTVTIVEDCQAVYTVNNLTNRDALVNGFVAATVTDPDGPISNAQIISGALPAGFTLNTITGAITVTDAAAVPASGTFQASIKTTDANGGTTTQLVTITIIADQEAVYSSPNNYNSNALVNGSVVATVTDQNGPITSAVLAPTSATLPAFLSLNSSTGAITVNTNPVVPGTYTFLVNTIDATGGRSEIPVAITINAAADLSIALSSSSAYFNGSTYTYYNGQNLTYTLVATNNGPNAATGAVVTYQLPTGLNFVSATGSYNAATGQWTIGNLASGQTATLTLVAQPITATTFTTVATISSSTFDPQLANNTATNTLTVTPAANLVVNNTVSAGPYNVGQPVTYTVGLMNLGPNTATNVQLTDLLPSGLTITNVTVPVGTYDAATGIWNIGTVNSGENLTLSIQAVPNTTGTFTTTATATSSVFDAVPGNNTSSNSITVGPTANLSVNVAATSTQANGDFPQNIPLIYTITVSNSGPSDATGVETAFTVPPGFTLNSFSTAVGSYNGSIWTIGNLISGQTVTLTINATPTNQGTFTATATVSGNEFDNFLPNNTNSSTITTGSPIDADVSIAMNAGTGPFYTGQQVTYTITATNNGPTTATGVVITDQLPAGLTFVSASSPGTTYDQATGVWTAGDIPVNSAKTLTIVAVPTVVGTITNTATKTGQDNIDNVPSNDMASATITVGAAADVAISLTASPGPNYQGQPVSFTLTATNNGPETATGVQVFDNFPVGIGYVIGSGVPSQGTINPSTGIWDVGTLANGQTATLTFDAIPSTTGNVTATASLYQLNEFDPNSANNISSVVLPVQPAADVQVTYTVSPGPYYVGQNIPYLIEVTNNGPRPATDLDVISQIPAGFTLYSSGASIGSFDANTGVWQIGTLNTGITETLSLVLVPSTAGTFTSTATASSPVFDPAPANNAAQVTVTVEGAANLAVYNIVSSGPYYIGQNITYTVQAINAGPSVATGVVVMDQLPAGLTLISSTTSVGSYDPATGLWNIGTLNNGQVETLTIVAQPNTLAPITTTATISANEADPDNGNNTASNTITADPSANLAVNVGVSAGPYNVGQDVTYTVTLSNNGPNTASNIDIDFLLPAGLSFTSASAPAGTSFDPISGVWTISTLAEAQSLVLTVVAAPVVTGVITTEATINPTAQFDPNLSNNVSSTSITVEPTADVALTYGISAGPYNENDVLTLTINAINLGPNTSQAIEVSNLIPSGFTLLSATPNTGTYDSGSGIWTIGNLANGQQATLTLQLELAATGTYTISSSATTLPTFDDNLSNNVASVTLFVDREAVYTNLTPINEDLLTANMVLATVADDNGGVVSAVILSGLLPNGISLDPVSGEIIVTDPAQVPAIVYTITVLTTDAQGGETMHTLVLNIRDDQEAVYTVIPSTNWFDNPNGSTLASLIDLDGPLVTLNLISSQFPAGAVSFNATTGEITVLEQGLLRPGTYEMTIQSVDAQGGETIQTIAIVFTGDRDGDGVDDFADIDNNNDGITDLMSDSGAFALGDDDNDEILNFADPDYFHAKYGAFRDLNGDGINDWFDIDLDGIINLFDLDMDGDGVLNTIEANAGLVPDAATTFDILFGRYLGVVSANGMPEAAQTAPNSGISVLPIIDFDGDSFLDFLDIDSDNDGMSDNYEAQPSFSPGYLAPLGIDLNRNGIDDRYDPRMDGTPLVPHNADSDAAPDYIDRDSDNDGKLDANEGFDENGNGYALDDLIARAAEFNAGPCPVQYDNTPIVDGVPAWLMDEDNDGIRNYIDPVNDLTNAPATYYYDTDKDGLIDLFDTDNCGKQASPPDNGGAAGVPDFRDDGTITPLPVELISLTATPVKDQVLVKWATAMEKDNDYFEVQRSRDGHSFTTIGKVAGIGNTNYVSNYAFTDAQPLSGLSYYRLRQVDLDGTATLTNMVAVRMATTAALTVSPYPNPFHNQVQVEINAPVTQQMVLRISDIRGVELYSRNVQVEEGKTLVDCNLNFLSAGTYVLSLTSDTEQVIHRLIKE